MYGSSVCRTFIVPNREIYRQSCHCGIFKSNSISRPRFSVINRLNNAIKQRPLLFGSTFAAFKCVAADALIQTYIEKRNFENINWKRSAVFCLFGFGYTGMVHHAVYCKLYPMLFGNVRSHRIMVAGQVAFDSLVHVPFLYFPVFYGMKGALYFDKGSSANVQDAVKKSLRTYFSRNMRSDVLASSKVWVPANVLTFAVVPMHLRVGWLAMVSFVWTAYLSLHRGGC